MSSFHPEGLDEQLSVGDALKLISLRESLCPGGHAPLTAYKANIQSTLKRTNSHF
ncbi:MAG: hypothetical protein AAFV71_18175 [Cyanobacteria bacterium J06633_8]